MQSHPPSTSLWARRVNNPTTRTVVGVYAAGPEHVDLIHGWRQEVATLGFWRNGVSRADTENNVLAGRQRLMVALQRRFHQDGTYADHLWPFAAWSTSFLPHPNKNDDYRFEVWPDWSSVSGLYQATLVKDPQLQNDVLFRMLTDGLVAEALAEEARFINDSRLFPQVDRVRLDCNTEDSKLREIYEAMGYLAAGVAQPSPKYECHAMQMVADLCVEQTRIAEFDPFNGRGSVTPFREGIPVVDFKARLTRLLEDDSSLLENAPHYRRSEPLVGPRQNTESPATGAFLNNLLLVGGLPSGAHLDDWPELAPVPWAFSPEGHLARSSGEAVRAAVHWMLASRHMNEVAEIIRLNPGMAHLAVIAADIGAGGVQGAAYLASEMRGTSPARNSVAVAVKEARTQVPMHHTAFTIGAAVAAANDSLSRTSSRVRRALQETDIHPDHREQVVARAWARSMEVGPYDIGTSRLTRPFRPSPPA